MSSTTSITPPSAPSRRFLAWARRVTCTDGAGKQRRGLGALALRLKVDKRSVRRWMSGAAPSRDMADQLIRQAALDGERFTYNDIFGRPQ